MHFIEESQIRLDTADFHALHTSKRMHFIEEAYLGSFTDCGTLAYVKTYALH